MYFDERKPLQLNDLKEDVSLTPPGSVIESGRSSAPLAKRAQFQGIKVLPYR